MAKITPFLWFDHQAEAAAKFYTSIFKNSKIGRIVRYGDGGPGPKGSVLTIGFKIAGQEFGAVNGGPIFNFTEATSFIINCANQKEVDYFWSKLTSGGGQESNCGWLKDKFGLSWQVVPVEIFKMLQDKNPKKVASMFQALMQMKKLDLKRLKDAFKAGR